ncbi:MAG: hypothetical protein H6745_22635 [Deltaproteobacteria bacterium]|nr:hypothetical protein [Deltaproteobacteria bacterium]
MRPSAPSPWNRRVALAAAAWLVALASPAARAAPPASPLRPNQVSVFHDDGGFKLVVDGRDFMVFGMNWGYVPVGENYRYDLWRQPDDFIKAALDRDMGMLKAMGVNAIRQFPGIPPRWVTYIYERYGIFTVMNHTTGRYGFQVGGAFVNPVDYSDPAFRDAVRADIRSLVETYRGTPGLLMWLLGNENNYGLEWSSFEIEALPAGEQQAAKAEFLYSLWGDLVRDIKALDTTHPVAIANGDLQYVDLVAKYVKPAGLDIMGSNVYRGVTSRDLFDVVKAKLDLPFMYTEFGSDAYDAREGREDQLAQARIEKGLWQEIYELSYGKGRAGNAIGGLLFQWSDGWWKYLQETGLDVHDTHASWPNEAYPFDFVPGRNNMNEEWFGICAKGPNDDAGLIPLYPRAAYYVLQAGFRQDPYHATLDEIRQHWGAIRVEDYAAPYERAQLAARVGLLERFKINAVRMDLSFYQTGGSHLDDPARAESRFDHLESFYLDVGFAPSARLSGNLALNVLANVPDNPIDEIFYENRGLPQTLTAADGTTVTTRDPERVAIHAASFAWHEDWFDLDAFYRTGHYHWGYEGDFFGLFPEAYYGDAIDIYNAAAPIGAIFTGHEGLEGLKVAFGPELYWGANPAIFAKYTRELGRFTLALIHHEDIARQTGAVAASSATPEQKTRQTTLYAATKVGPLKVELGAMTGGSTKLGERFLIAETTDGPSWRDSGYLIEEDRVAFVDTLGAKLKLTWESPGLRWYLQGGYRGLVADAGADATVTFTGWRLKEDGRGNHWSVNGGAAFNVGDLQIAPNVLYQKPLVGPLPLIEDYYNVATGVYYPTIKGRNILDDPFVVRGNREQLAAELMITWDPTPGTWLWAWDNEIVEDAPLALSLDFIYRHLPTIMDAGVGRLADQTPFGFPTSPPAHDLWEIAARAIANPGGGVRLIADVYGGTGQANGDDPRLITRFGVIARLDWRRLSFRGAFKLNDWGPYDYHRDFNFTFPVQLLGDLSFGLTAPEWLGGLYSRFGVRVAWRSLDEHSNRYAADPSDPGVLGDEWEIRTYFQVAL